MTSGQIRASLWRPNAVGVLYLRSMSCTKDRDDALRVVLARCTFVVRSVADGVRPLYSVGQNRHLASDSDDLGARQRRSGRHLSVAVILAVRWFWTAKQDSFLELLVCYNSL